MDIEPLPVMMAVIKMIDDPKCASVAQGIKESIVKELLMLLREPPACSNTLTIEEADNLITSAFAQASNVNLNEVTMLIQVRVSMYQAAMCSLLEAYNLSTTQAQTVHGKKKKAMDYIYGILLNVIVCASRL